MSAASDRIISRLEIAKRGPEARENFHVWKALNQAQEIVREETRQFSPEAKKAASKLREKAKNNLIDEEPTDD